MARQQITTEPFYKGHPIMATPNTPCITNILAGYHDRLHYMTDHHDQVSVMHLVMSFPEHVPADQANRILSKSLEVLRKNLKNNGIDSQTGWVHEHAEYPEGPAQASHFHIGLIADGSKTQSAIKHANNLNNLLSKHLSNTDKYVNYCPPDPRYNQQNLHPIEQATAIKIRQDKPNAEAQFDNALAWLGYHSKTTQKGHAPARVREFEFSRLPKISSSKK